LLVAGVYVWWRIQLDPPGDPGARVEELYGLFPALREKHRAPASSLSGGQRKLLDLGVFPLSHGQTLKVLVVDDDPKAVELIAALVVGLASSVVRAYGGREAIAVATQELPDVIVLDLMMPEVNGFDVVEALREHPATARIPILVVTAKRITVVAPFYPYARQDKKHRGREPISARLMADLFKTAGADRLMAVDLHTAHPFDHEGFTLAVSRDAGYASHEAFTRAFRDQLLRGFRVQVEDDALMSGAQEAAHHVGSHPSQPDHS